MNAKPFVTGVRLDWEAWLKCLRREGTPQRVHFMELFLDGEVETEICSRFPQILDGLDRYDPHFDWLRYIAVQRFLGYDYVVCNVEGSNLPHKEIVVADTASLSRQGGRHYVEERKGPITTWAEFEAYPWPKLEALGMQKLEWFQKNLPEDMCIIGGLFGHFMEDLSFLMGFETLCFSLYEQRDLVAAIAQRILEINRAVAQCLLGFNRVKALWGTDDMGYRSGLLINPSDMRQFVLPAHTLMAQMAHDAGRLYLLHSCGKLEKIMPDLLEDVHIDARHSFEDTIEDVREAKMHYGSRIALIGGIDLNFICFASEAEIRQRVQETLTICQPGGGYCLGTGNSVANYVPVENYLVMLDEGRKF